MKRNGFYGSWRQERRYMQGSDSFISSPSRGTDHGRIPPFLHSCISSPAIEVPVVAQELNRLGQQGPPILFSSLKLFILMPIQKQLAAPIRFAIHHDLAANGYDQIPGEACFRAGGVSWRGIFAGSKITLQKSGSLS